ncbi:MAG: ribosome small subunit-dependent GTPase A [Ignavibacteria bacterium]|jgi:ribosome biogenesis GTPase|nr:ribosome small subunit-dependent GTPase A [Ignavibacteria bacterium]
MKYEQAKQTPIRKTRANRLTLVKTTGEVPDEANYGKVCSIVGNKVIVETTDKKEYECVLTGTVISDNSNLANIIAAGDNVWFLLEENSLGSIVKVENRETFFSRKDPSNTNKEQILAANIDNVVIFFAADEPLFNPKLVDRFLIAATLGEVKPILCVNKIDLIEDDSYIYDYLEIYKNNGIEVFTISVLENKGIELIKKCLVGAENLITGPSGAGKSSFLNLILGYEAQMVREISYRTNKGMHTTSFSRRYVLDNQTAIIDTPGLREFGLWDMQKEDFRLFFPDFIKYLNKCRFPSCTHTHEPDCAVKEAVESNEVDYERYESYISLLED